MAMNGNNIILMKNGVAMGAVVSHDVQTEGDQMEVASNIDGQYREYIRGPKTWAMTATCLVISSAIFASMIQAGQTFSMKSCDRLDRVNVHGQARLEECRITATHGHLVKGYFKFKGIDYLFARMQGGGDYNNDFNNDFYIG